jgi:hypothetical protein
MAEMEGKMTRRGAIATVLMLSMLSIGVAASAKPLDDVKAYGDLMKWLEQAVASALHAGAILDKDRLITYLDDLGATFEEMLRDKRKIRIALDDKPVDQVRLKTLAHKIGRSVESAGDSLTNVAFLIRQQNRGDEIAKQLQDALDGKESWLRSLKIGVASDDEYKELSSQVDTSRKALEKANTELASLVQGLKQQHQ